MTTSPVCDKRFRAVMTNCFVTSLEKIYFDVLLFFVERADLCGTSSMGTTIFNYKKGYYNFFVALVFVQVFVFPQRSGLLYLIIIFSVFPVLPAG